MAKGLGKGDIAARVSAQLKGTRSEGDRALNAVLNAVAEALKQGKRVTLTGFSLTKTRSSPGRIVRGKLPSRP